MEKGLDNGQVVQQGPGAGSQMCGWHAGVGQSFECDATPA